MLKVGINGFGRIGRAIWRINKEKRIFEVASINDINPDINNLAYLMKYDSTYGRLNDSIKTEGNKIIVNNNKPIVVSHKENIDEVSWSESDVDIVIDSSGIHNNLLKVPNLKRQGLKKAIITHSPEEKHVDKTIIVGVNEDAISKDDFIISSSICDANAFAPTINTLNREYGVDHGFLTTLHPWLQYQNLLDGPSPSFAYPRKIYHHYVLGRASPPSLIPKPTSCVTASCKVLNYLKGKFLSLSFRIPTATVSSADISVKLNKKITADEIINLFKEEEKKQKWKIFHNNFEPLVSSDFKGSEYSAIVDHRWTMINNSNYLKLILWYDNEWGYGCRVVDLIKHLEHV